MKEDFISYLWENKLLYNNLVTIDGKAICIVNQGLKNANAGPDFLDARIMIGNTLWAGNIEIHVKASDWIKHGHEADAAYNNVVLHVVYDYDTDKVPIPTLAVKDKFKPNIYDDYQDFIKSQRWVPCEKSIRGLQGFTWLSWLDRMMAEKIEKECETILKQLETTHFDWEEVFYRCYMHYFGLKVNNFAFERLAMSLPLKTLLKHSNNLLQTEALLFGTAGFLEKDFKDHYPLTLQQEFSMLKSKFGLVSMSQSEWKFLRLRPINFPTVRLAQAATLIYNNGAFFSRIKETRSLEELRTLFDIKPSLFWKTHYCFDRMSVEHSASIGTAAINILIINAVVPILFLYGKYYNQPETSEKAISFLEEMETEDNMILRKFQESGVVLNNAAHSQALLYLYSNYCKLKRCLDCRIFYALTTK